MLKALDDVLAVAENKKIDLRTAAFVKASERLVNAIDVKGTVEFFKN